MGRVTTPISSARDVLQENETPPLLLHTFFFTSFSSCKKKEMSGLVKAKKYDWKDSNLALFGSDTEKQVNAACQLGYSPATLDINFTV